MTGHVVPSPDTRYSLCVDSPVVVRQVHFEIHCSSTAMHGGRRHQGLKAQVYRGTFDLMTIYRYTNL